MNKPLIWTIVGILLIAFCALIYSYQNGRSRSSIILPNNNTQATMNNPISTGTIIVYEGVTFTAPNTPGSAYHVIATKDGKTLWEIGKDIATKKDQGNAPHGDGIESLSVRNFTEFDIDTSLANAKDLEKYVGKPALFILETNVSSPLPSTHIVDMQTGATLSVVAFN